MFQSLFFWNHHLYHSNCCQDWFQCGFQSLFFWNHHLYSLYQEIYPPSSIVSILVFLEPPLIPPDRPLISVRIFVSILVFLEPPLIPGIGLAEVEYSAEFQSLFFWNHHLYKVAVIKFEVQVEFQSLFFWNHHLYLMRQWSSRYGGSVSILVFLEPPLIHHFSDKYLKFRILHPTHSASFSSCSAQIECIFCQFYAGFACLCWS